jgi:energy-coupling factor transporter ATP-binding protein EcfA2
MLQNFKKFPELDLRFTHDRNILVGDNESGKSTILLALDLVLSDSRHRVEALGVESLLSQSAVRQFQEGERRADQLPVLTADVFLSNGGDPDLNGRQNLAGINADGLRMRIAPMTEEYGQDIHNVLQQDPDNFPYEYYSVRFSTFSGGHFASFRRYLRHLLLDSARSITSTPHRNIRAQFTASMCRWPIGTGLKTVTGNRKCTSAPGICQP